MVPELYKIQCIITRGGFDSERVFEIKGHVKGAAPLDYFFDLTKMPLGGNNPPLGESLSGFVAARLVEAHGSLAIISLPSGDVIEVDRELLLV